MEFGLFIQGYTPKFRREVDPDAEHHAFMNEIEVVQAAEALAKRLRARRFDGEPVRAKVDLRDDSSSNKRWGWIKKGVPFVVELGPRDVAAGTVAARTLTAGSVPAGTVAAGTLATGLFGTFAEFVDEFGGAGVPVRISRLAAYGPSARHTAPHAPAGPSFIR